ncbi:LysM peptidoglycan-binding domain-containing protein [Arcicella sp. LKC2W]|uniref:LysM peptidoglycan-binding domain-containing protein n=1 Tax=Arcicella sp. LKC2W TaxID=2984198 RepID=UPI002B1FE547|nr:LysM peptidoglycan-binding domain-containing protein [Arcicella sp. LKC2W]MEA5458103.1 LysM peptidoglycan-binding domain-containing protein [Arcicella sp. LKC2W]
MKKRLSLLILAFLPCVWTMAQDLPRSLFVGSVNVKIESDAKAIIEREIDNLNTNQKYLSSLVAKMNLYFPIIEKILAEEGVPDEFKYLCVQESAFNPEAISTSNAIGYWQFKRETAQEVGMRVDGVIDERKHIAAATKGAAVYLSRNNLILKNWVSTLLSYRLGLGAVRRMSAIDWAYKNEVSVNASTDWYVLRFLAHRHFLEKQYKQSKNQVSSNYIFEYTNSRGKNLTDIAQELDVPLSDVIVNNTWLKSTTVPDDKDYIVYLPVNSQQFLDLKIKNDQQKFSEDQVAVNKDLGFPVLVKLTNSPVKDEPIFYEINGKKGILARQGDTPESLAERAGINLKRFLKFNDLDDNDRIIPNEVYYLKRKDRRAVVAYHTVEGYETLWKISQMYGVQLEDLMAKNRITQIQRLQKGRLLWLIETRPEGQSVEYVQTPEEKSVTIINEKPVVSEPKKQPTTQPVTKKPTVSQNNQSDVTIIETKNEPNISVVATPSKPVNPTTVTPKPIDNTNTQVNNTTVTTKPSSPSISTPPPVVYNPTSTVGKSNKIIKSHIVEPKQTFFSISRLYNMSVDELYSLNDMYSGSALRIGQAIKVFQPSSTPITGATRTETKTTTTYTYPTDNKPIATTENTTTTIVREVVTSPAENIEVASNHPSPTVATPPVNNIPTTVNSPVPTAVNKPFAPATNTKPNYKIIHTIQAGETIYRVSKIYGVSVESIKNWNTLSDNTVEIGQELKILGGNVKPNYTGELTSTTADTNQNNNYKYHILKAGETVFRVSQIYGVTVDEVVKWNNIKNFSVSVGQKIVIKK